jgi:hypothetical protein
MVAGFLPVLASATLVVCAQAKKWNNTGHGSIIFEEALSLPWPELGPVSK